MTAALAAAAFMLAASPAAAGQGWPPGIVVRFENAAAAGPEREVPLLPIRSLSATMPEGFRSHDRRGFERGRAAFRAVGQAFGLNCSGRQVLASDVTTTERVSACVRDLASARKWMRYWEFYPLFGLSGGDSFKSLEVEETLEVRTPLGSYDILKKGYERAAVSLVAKRSVLESFGYTGLECVHDPSVHMNRVVAAVGPRGRLELAALPDRLAFLEDFIGAIEASILRGIEESRHELKRRDLANLSYSELAELNAKVARERDAAEARLAEARAQSARLVEFAAAARLAHGLWVRFEEEERGRTLRGLEAMIRDRGAAEQLVELLQTEAQRRALEPEGIEKMLGVLESKPAGP